MAVWLQAAGPGATVPAGSGATTKAAPTAPASNATPAPTKPVPVPAAVPGAPTTPAPAPSGAPVETQAAQALDRARAAYEYGDMEMVADAARLVAEGRLHPTPLQRAQALRFLGIALYLTGRPEGAETAFFDLLRLKPTARLDPTTTRPDVITFFENVRARHYDDIRHALRSQPRQHFILSLLPPAGQFQNGSRARGLTIGALEIVSLGLAIGTYAQLRSWVNDRDQTFGSHTADAETLKILNNVAGGVFFATVIVGIIDGIANFHRDPDDLGPLVFVTPGGAGFHF